MQTTTILDYQFWHKLFSQSVKSKISTNTKTLQNRIKLWKNELKNSITIQVAKT